MADWLKYKGEGPWECIPPNKITYDEGDKTTSVLNPVWVVDQDGITDRTKHDPCGYWPRLPYTAPPPEVVPMFEIYHEMFPSQCAQVIFEEVADYEESMETFITFDANDYDGVVGFYFETIAMNKTAYPFKLQLIDNDDVVYAEMVIPANTTGTSGYEMFRERIEFTPSLTNTTYGLRGASDPASPTINIFPPEVFISNARIIVIQDGASKTRIQIPLFCTDWTYAMDLAPVTEPVGYPIYNLLSTYTGVDNYTNIWPDKGEGVPASQAGVWQFNADELDNISKVVFSVMAKGPKITTLDPIVKTGVMIDTGLYGTHSYWGLYTTPAATADTACSSGTGISGSGFQNVVWQDGCTGAIFTPISETFLEPEPNPWGITLYPDMTSVIGNVDIFQGWQFDANPWQHSVKWFGINVKVGTAIQDAILTVVPGSTDLRKDVTLSYVVRSVVRNDLYVALFDITTDIMVVGSELTWTSDEGWVRKQAEILPINLINGHYYEFRVKCPGQVGVIDAPEINDAQLWLNVDPISHLTAWYRIFHQPDGESDDWQIPVSWGGDVWGYGVGANSIIHRAKPIIPTGSEVYFEQTSLSLYNDIVGYENHQYVSVLNLTDLDETGSGEAAVEITGSKLVWSNSDYNVKVLKRTEALPITNEMVLGTKYGDSVYLYMTPSDGFLVVKIK